MIVYQNNLNENVRTLSVNFGYPVVAVLFRF